jgi:hypothetical protein
MNSYDCGDQVIMQGTFTVAATGALIDPTNVFFQYKAPTLPVTIVTWQFGVDPEVTNSSVGVYQVTLTVNTTGNWHYRFYSTGTGTGAAEGAFNVKSSEFC